MSATKQRDPGRDANAPGPATPWRAPTRRAFVAMIGAAAAALAVRNREALAPPAAPAEPERPWHNPWSGSTRWIGHC
jgi:hypothetical protein